MIYADKFPFHDTDDTRREREIRFVGGSLNDEERLARLLLDRNAAVHRGNDGDRLNRGINAICSSTDDDDDDDCVEFCDRRATQALNVIIEQRSLSRDRGERSVRVFFRITLRVTRE